MVDDAHFAAALLHDVAVNAGQYPIVDQDIDRFRDVAQGVAPARPLRHAAVAGNFCSRDRLGLRLSAVATFWLKRL